LTFRMNAMPLILVYSDPLLVSQILTFSSLQCQNLAKVGNSGEVEGFPLVNSRDLRQPLSPRHRKIVISVLA
jgi:hypothetical protein